MGRIWTRPRTPAGGQLLSPNIAPVGPVQINRNAKMSERLHMYALPRYGDLCYQGDNFHVCNAGGMDPHGCLYFGDSTYAAEFVTDPNWLKYKEFSFTMWGSRPSTSTTNSHSFGFVFPGTNQGFLYLIINYRYDGYSQTGSMALWLDTIGSSYDLLRVGQPYNTDSAKISYGVANTFHVLTYSIGLIQADFRVYIDGREGIIGASDEYVQWINLPASSGDRNPQKVAFGGYYNSSGNLVKASEPFYWGGVSIHEGLMSTAEAEQYHKNVYQVLEEANSVRFRYPVAAPAGAIMNQMQGPNMGSDLFNGTIQ